MSRFSTERSTPALRYLDGFLEMLSAERGAAANTLEAYKRDLGDFLSALQKTGRDAGSATSDDILSYLQTLSARGLAASSQARKLSALRQFFRFLYAEGLRNDDPGGIDRESETGPRRCRRSSASTMSTCCSRQRETPRGNGIRVRGG